MAMTLNPRSPAATQPRSDTHQGDMVIYRESDEVTWPAIITLVDPSNPRLVCLAVLMTEGIIFPTDVPQDPTGLTEHSWSFRA